MRIFNMKLEAIAKFVVSYTMRLFMLIPGVARNAYRILIRQLVVCESCGDHYLSLLRRPKRAKQFVSIEESTPIRRKTAIVMQGPLISKDDFTVETVRIYHKIYPGVVVIVSTWEDEDQEILEKLSRLERCYVVLSKKPAHSGVLNLNYQVVTTIAGIRCAKELGLNYVAKTRCDFRFVKLGLIEYLVGLCDIFPLDKGIRYQHQRIIVMGDYLGSLFRAFWVADRFSFGVIDDMLSFWNYELDSIDRPKEVVRTIIKKTPKTWREITEEGFGAEPRILLNYLKRVEGSQPECSVKNFWEVLRKQFITLSYDELGAYWFKAGQGVNETSVRGDYYGELDNSSKCLCYNWNFTRWLALYQGSLQYKEEYEKFQNNNIGF